MVAKKLYFMDCHLAGRKYHDADEVWEQLKVGTVLMLERDKENRTDANAVMVVYKNQNGEEFKLAISHVPITRPSPACLKWAGRTSSSVVSVN